MDLVSAICVTHPSRFGLLQRAIISFLQQDYAKRELIVLTGHPRHAEEIRKFLNDVRLRALVNATSPIDGVLVRVVAMNFRQPMEAFAHAAVWAEGEWLACWDDDDLSHPGRLTFQKSHTGRGRASVFTESMYYFYDSDELFVTNFSQPSGRGAERCAASSLLFHRGAFQPTDLSARDTWACHLLDRIASRNRHECLAGEPGLFIVGANGDNYRSADLHRRMGTLLPATWTRSQLLERSSRVEEWLNSYCFPQESVDVCGKDAQAFVSTGHRTWPSWLLSALPPPDWKQGIPNRTLMDRLRIEQSHRQRRR